MAIQTKMVCRNILRQIHKSTIKKKLQTFNCVLQNKENTNKKSEWNPYCSYHFHIEIQIYYMYIIYNYSCWLIHLNPSTPVVTCWSCYVGLAFVRFPFVNKTHVHNNCNGKTPSDSFQLREAERPIFKTMRLIQHEFCWLTLFCRGNWLLPKPGPF